MKTIDLEEIKNAVAKAQFDALYENLFPNEKAFLVDMIATDYAKKCCDLQINTCAEDAHLFIMNKEAILNTPNVVTTK